MRRPLALAALVLGAGALALALAPGVRADEPAAAAVRTLSPAELEARSAGPREPVVLDVRTPAEYAAGHVPGARNVPHDQLESRIGELAGLEDREVVVYCRTGRRAALALEVLERHGFRRLEHLDGDIEGWKAAGKPLERPSDAVP